MSIQNKNKQFSIVAIRINEKCNKYIKKTLHTGYYLFNEWVRVDDNNNIVFDSNNCLNRYFFGKNISVQAIVGKNGSGKSSLLEIMYRMINNFGHMLVQKQKRRAAENLYFIEDLYADLYFVVGDCLGVLYCSGNTVAYSFGDDKYLFGEKSDSFINFQYCNHIKNEKIIEITKCFFYTIVTNYSIQSFIDSDYKIERLCRFEADTQSGIDSSAIWINSLFHKNDGYITPIVLNPYRNEGVIDLKKEYQLTNYRLSAILIESKNNKRQFIDNYQFDGIEYIYAPSNIFLKFEEGRQKGANFEDFIRNFISIIHNKKSFAAIILREFDSSKIESLNEVLIIAHIYLVYKTLSIASKYPSFNDYENLGVIRNYKKEATKEEENKLILLVKDIKRDKSHITVKIRQTEHFIKSDLSFLINNNAKYHFDYEQYIKSLNLKSKLKGLDAIMEFLPPPLFNFDIKLNKLKNGKHTKGESILFQRMSSGERQFIYTISTYIYHIKNLLSIQSSNRVKYRSINLILDEVEICFHPEYQRMFINKLMLTIQRLHLNTHCSFNIIIATHSPFILSDIPKSNILYLQEGSPISKSEFKDPFGANINDILHQSFFLENGFIGEFAKKKINTLLIFLTTDKKSDWTPQSAQNIINCIGEPIVKNQLQFLYDKKFKEAESIQEKIKRLERELEMLKIKK